MGREIAVSSAHPTGSNRGRITFAVRIAPEIKDYMDEIRILMSRRLGIDLNMTQAFDYMIKDVLTREKALCGGEVAEKR